MVLDHPTGVLPSAASSKVTWSVLSRSFGTVTDLTCTDGVLSDRKGGVGARAFDPNVDGTNGVSLVKRLADDSAILVADFGFNQDLLPFDKALDTSEWGDWLTVGQSAVIWKPSAGSTFPRRGASNEEVFILFRLLNPWANKFSRVSLGFSATST